MHIKENVAPWIEPYEILEQANHFRIASQRLQGSNQNGESSLGMPSSICAVLSIELYLKYIIFNQTKDLSKLKCHNLKALFDKIILEIQMQILNNVSCSISKDDFLKTLEEFQDAFEIWRYVYEYNKTTVSTRLHEISDLLNGECRRIESEKQY